jgi:hypothetical protein
MNQDGVDATRWAQSTRHWCMCSSNVDVMFPSRLRPQIAKILPLFLHFHLTLRTLAFLSSSPILDHAGRLPTITSGFSPSPILLSLFHLRTSIALIFCIVPLSLFFSKKNFRLSHLPSMQSLKKVVLLEPVAGLGLQGDVVPVKAGRARNVLIPRKQALYVSGNMHKPSPFLPNENFDLSFSTLGLLFR